MIEPFAVSVPGVSAALDDPVIAAVAGLGPELSVVAADIYQSVSELMAGARSALATYASVEQEVSDQFSADAEKVRAAFRVAD